MDWDALNLSLRLAGATLVVLMPLALLTGRWLAFHRFRGKPLLEALLALPLVLPPTVLGFYLLMLWGGDSWFSRFYESLTGHRLVFTFDALLLASLIFNIPFAVQPVQRAFDAIAPDLREAAVCCGISRWRTFWRIELPLAWPGILSAMVMTFAHTLGEFGVVLMVGGNIPGETRTIAISIYDRVQAFQYDGATAMSATLLVISLLAISVTYGISARARGQHG